MTASVQSLVLTHTHSAPCSNAVKRMNHTNRCTCDICTAYGDPHWSGCITATAVVGSCEHTRATSHPTSHYFTIAGENESQTKQADARVRHCCRVHATLTLQDESCRLWPGTAKTVVILSVWRFAPPHCCSRAVSAVQHTNQHNRAPTQGLCQRTDGTQ